MQCKQHQRFTTQAIHKLEKGIPKRHTGPMTILGIDVGGERLGVAIGDSETRLASPWGVVAARPEAKAFATLTDLIQKEQVGKVVIGLPFLLAKREQSTTQQEVIRAWADRFHDTCNVDIVFEDETLSSALATTWQHEQGGKSKRDDLAALAILQSYLDRGAF